MRRLVVSRLRLDGFVFDLDGVITRTQELHFLAWKKTFNELLRARGVKKRFTKKDYLAYVDGKPRVNGVESFLKTIGLKLPLGRKNDFGFNSVHGIANLKNKRFESILEERGVKVFKPTIRFVLNLKKQGFKVAVISASKHCRAILRKAGIEKLFDVIVDGNDAERLGLKGKPDPDVFEEAAKGLGVEKERCAIVEDSVAGIQAGRKGGFGLLIGIDRGGNKRALAKAGADIVVKSLSEVRIARVRAKEKSELIKKMSEEMSKGKQVVLFADYDGTLTPIVDDPGSAVLGRRMKKVLKDLSRKARVIIMSGRSLRDIKKLVGLKGLDYSGCHGFEMEVNGKKIELERAREFLPAIQEAEKMLNGIKVRGFLLERKRFSLACHYRLVRPGEVENVKKKVEGVARKLGLRTKPGKKVLELMPAIEWDKGKALKMIISTLKPDPRKSIILYMGDDLTDEDAFKTVNRARGVSVLVASKDAYDTTSAKYFLKGVKEAEEFLKWLDDFYDNKRFASEGKA